MQLPTQLEPDARYPDHSHLSGSSRIDLKSGLWFDYLSTNTAPYFLYVRSDIQPGKDTHGTIIANEFSCELNAAAHLAPPNSILGKTITLLIKPPLTRKGSQ